MSYIFTLKIDGTDNIVTRVPIKSIIRTLNLHNNLEPTTNTLSFDIHRDATVLARLMATPDRVLVKVTKDGADWFNGYLTEDYKFSVLNSGVQPIKLQAEDPGIKLLKAPWKSSNGAVTRWSGYKICDASNPQTSMVHQIAALAGVTVSTGIQGIPDAIVEFVQSDESKTTFWDVLKKLLFEVGFTFGFTVSGQLTIYQFKTETTSTTKSFSNTASKQTCGKIEVSKNRQQYQKIEISWKKWKTIIDSDAVIFSDTTGGDASKKCHINVSPWKYYPESADSTLNVYSTYKMADGSNIIMADNISVSIINDVSILLINQENLFTRANIKLKNNSGSAAYIRKLEITADYVVIEDGDNITTAGITSNTDKILKYQSQYIHDTVSAENLANIVCQFYKYSFFYYTLSSNEDYQIGDIVRIEDNQLSGIDTYARIVTRVDRVASDSIYYGCVAVSAWSSSIIPVTQPMNSGSQINNNISRIQNSVMTVMSEVEATTAVAESTAEEAAALRLILLDISNDGKLTPVEKKIAYREWLKIEDEYLPNVDIANNYEIDHEAYDDAYTALELFLITGPTALLIDIINTTSDLQSNGAVFRARFNSYYTALTNLKNAVAAKSKILADQAQELAEKKVTIYPSKNAAELVINGAYVGALAGDCYVEGGIYWITQSRPVYPAPYTWTRLTPKDFGPLSTAPVNADIPNNLVTGDKFYNTQTSSWMQWSGAAWTVITTSTDYPPDSSLLVYYGMDNLPEIPNGTTPAYLEDSFATPNGWTAQVGRGSISYPVPGQMRITQSPTASDVWTYCVGYSGPSILHKYFRIRTKTSNPAFHPDSLSGGGAPYGVWELIGSFAGWDYWQTYCTRVEGGYAFPNLYLTGGNTGDTIDVDWYYIGDGSYNATSIQDGSGNNRHTFLNLAIPVPGISGRALWFPGTNAIPMPTIPTWGKIATISVWVKNWSNGYLFQLGVNSFICNRYNATTLTVFDGVSDRFFTIPDVLNDGDWHHIGIVYSATMIQMVFDAQLLAESYTNTHASLSVNQYLGASSTGQYAVNAGCCIDEFRLYNRALTLSEIRSLYQIPNNGALSTGLTDISGDRVKTGRILSNVLVGGEPAMEQDLDGAAIYLRDYDATGTGVRRGYMGYGRNGENYGLLFKDANNKVIHDIPNKPLTGLVKNCGHYVINPYYTGGNITTIWNRNWYGTAGDTTTDSYFDITAMLANSNTKAVMVNCMIGVASVYKNNLYDPAFHILYSTNIGATERYDSARLYSGSTINQAGGHNTSVQFHIVFPVFWVGAVAYIYLREVFHLFAGDGAFSWAYIVGEYV